MRDRILRNGCSWLAFASTWSLARRHGFQARRRLHPRRRSQSPHPGIRRPLEDTSRVSHPGPGRSYRTRPWTPGGHPARDPSTERSTHNSAMSDPPPWVSDILSGTYGPLLADSASGLGPLPLWPALRHPTGAARFVVSSGGRTAVLCGPLLGGGMGGTRALMHGGAAMAIGADVAKVLASQGGRGGLVLREVDVRYARPVPLPGWIEVGCSRLGGAEGGGRWRAVLRDREKDRDLVVVETTWGPAEDHSGQELRHPGPSADPLDPIPDGLRALVSQHGGIATAGTDSSLLSSISAGLPIVWLQLQPPADPRTADLPEMVSGARFVWVSRREGRLYRRAASVASPAGLEAWHGVDSSELLAADGWLHPAVLFTLVDAWIALAAITSSRKMAGTASLRLAFTPAGSAFRSGWMRTTAKATGSAGRRVSVEAEVTDAEGTVLAVAQASYATIDLGPAM
ncbi:hypothetical protein DFJ74DRAFT_720290 [Hyaloraphidium curvatum]|nr:hypothetical protein DFJ74DRAFT_720290 [Hyaloraphidium curvatum]